MARTRAPDHDIQRERILELAATQFAQTSYAGASMTDLATASGASKARLYHYYESKEAILFDLLDRYTQQLMRIVTHTLAESRQQQLSARETFAELVRAFLIEYETSRSRHIALLNDIKYLVDTQRDVILERQRSIVAAFAEQLARAYPHAVTKENRTPLTMMVFGMINWTFTWLKPSGPLSYREFADHVIEVLEHGLGASSHGFLASMPIDNDSDKN